MAAKKYDRTYRPKSKGSEGPKKSVKNGTAAKRAAAKSKKTAKPSNTAARAKVNKKGSEGPKKSTYDIKGKDGELYTKTGSPRQAKSKNAKSQKEHLGGKRVTGPYAPSKGASKRRTEGPKKSSKKK